MSFVWLQKFQPALLWMHCPVYVNFHLLFRWLAVDLWEWWKNLILPKCCLFLHSYKAEDGFHYPEFSRLNNVLFVKHTLAFCDVLPNFLISLEWGGRQTKQNQMKHGNISSRIFFRIKRGEEISFIYSLLVHFYTVGKMLVLPTNSRDTSWRPMVTI